MQKSGFLKMRHCRVFANWVTYMELLSASGNDLDKLWSALVSLRLCASYIVTR